MSYLLRVVLPDQPGSLGAVATAIGHAGGDIVSLDVVERGPGVAVDDILVELPAEGLADVLITSAESVPGVRVESLRRHVAGTELHRDLDLVEELAANPARAYGVLAHGVPGVFRASWAVVASATGPRVSTLASSVAAPRLAADALPWLPLARAERLDPDAPWVPPSWRERDTELAAAPLGRPEVAVLVARVGGPAFRASEVVRLAHLAGITATVADGERVPAAAGR